ncbi:MAG TPA: hypothetical protein VFS21_33710 [Roseiflexaceae bacterium]|nr:hypothetical protein [Roseiflexaceae bacterium]
MYCPHCAAHLAATDARCPRCDLDVRPIAQLLSYARARTAEEQEAAARAQRWQRQRHSLGLLLVMCSLLVGCFIPLSAGLFSGASWLGALIAALAGLIGVLLILGAMLILASEGAILNSSPSAPGGQGGPATPLLAQDTPPMAAQYDRPVGQPAKR